MPAILPDQLEDITSSDYADCTDLASAVTLLNRLKDYSLLNDGSIRNQINLLIETVGSIDERLEKLNETVIKIDQRVKNESD